MVTVSMISSWVVQRGRQAYSIFKPLTVNSPPRAGNRGRKIIRQIVWAHYSLMLTAMAMWISMWFQAAMSSMKMIKIIVIIFTLMMAKETSLTRLLKFLILIPVVLV